MTDKIYLELLGRLNQFQVKFPPVESLIPLLKEIYSEEEAKIASKFPPGFHNLKQLSARLNRDEREMEKLLKTMAKKGLVFTTKEGTYALQSFIPGVVEFQLMRATKGSPKEIEVAGMISRFEEEVNAFAKKIIEEHPQLLDHMPKANIGRTITIDQALSSEKEVYPYENLLELIKNEDSFALAPCYCQNQKRLDGDPCKIKNGPDPRCITVGRSADYIVEQGFGERVTKEKALDVLKAAEEAGLVHNISNILGKVEFICNCCSCCCPFLKGMKIMKGRGLLSYSNFIASVTENDCIGCGECIERCQMGALSLNGNTIHVDEGLCVGCGICVSSCPTGILSMKRRSRNKPPEIPDERIVGLGGVADPF